MTGDTFTANQIFIRQEIRSMSIVKTCECETWTESHTPVILGGLTTSHQPKKNLPNTGLVLNTREAIDKSETEMRRRK